MHRSLSSNAERRVQVMIKFRVDSVKNENKIRFMAQDLDRLLGSDLASRCCNLMCGCAGDI